MIKDIVLALICSFTILYGLTIITEYTDRDVRELARSHAQADARVEAYVQDRDMALRRAKLEEEEAKMELLLRQQEERTEQEESQ